MIGWTPPNNKEMIVGHRIVNKDNAIENVMNSMKIRNSFIQNVKNLSLTNMENLQLT